MSVEGERQNSGESLEDQYKEVTVLPFDQVKRGSEILVFTGRTLEEVKDIPDYTIKVVGIRKNGLLVQVSPAYKGMGGDFTARMPGSFRGIYPDVSRNSLDYTPGVNNGVLEVADEKVASMLHFENLKDLDGERMAKSSTTSPIRKILFKT
ncbi:MAG: hypothetical protein HYV37_03210 [Candidatus Levyibacteriota bacterium]|nr:MAG: hypothetical protein HYV37_03210 [Candidatus Levybacteria bacterium]